MAGILRLIRDPADETSRACRLLIEMTIIDPRVLILLFVFVLQVVTGALSAQRPDDPLFSHQVSYRNAGAEVDLLRRSNRLTQTRVEMAAGIHLDVERAWTLTTGSRSVVVALLDDGFFYRHEDIADNVWRNQGEVGVDESGLDKETNRVDDDGNGYVDDVIGWDFVFEDPDPDHYIFDGMDRTRIQPYRHSISALGIIGAVGNNGIGVAGINWQVSMMMLKIGAQGEPRGETGLPRVTRAARAIEYAVDNGARVINWSGFVRPRLESEIEPLREAVRYASEHGVLLVVGAGNDALDLDEEANRFYPQYFDMDNVIRVAQLGFDGGLYRYEIQGEVRGSNFGLDRVEIAAIGENFTTGLHHGEPIYWTGNGTSDAGPVVSGVAALILSVRPDLKAADLKQILMDSAVRLPELRGKVGCGGVVNAYRAVQMALDR